MQWIPKSRGGRIRLATLGLGLLLTLAPALQLDHGGGNDGATTISLVATGLVAAILVITAVVRRQISVLEGPATAVLAVLVGIGLQNPLGVISLCTGVIVAQAMYGSRFSELLRVLAFLPVVPAAVALSVSTITTDIRWYSAACLGLIPTVPLFAGLVHMLKSALESQAEAKRRARFMARLTGDLLASTTLQQAMPILVQGAAEICRLTPGLVLVATRVDRPDGQPAPAVVQAIFGASLENPPTEIPAEIVAELPDLDLNNLREVKGLGKRLSALGMPAHRKWYAHGGNNPLNGQMTNLGLFGIPMSWPEMLLGAPGSRATELVGILQRLSEHRATTFEYLQEKQVMLMAANRDDVTGLAKRSAFLDRLEDLVEDDQTPSVALILVGLDGLGPLAVEHGSPAAAVVASRLARRLVDLVGDRGSTGRFSDHRFAVALPVTDDEDGVTQLAETLRQELSAPIPIDDGAASFSVSLSVSTGVARAGAGTTGWDLAERAALALRLDREAVDEPLVRTA